MSTIKILSEVHTCPLHTSTGIVLLYKNKDTNSINTHMSTVITFKEKHMSNTHMHW